MQDQFVNPIYLSAHQLADLFNNSQAEIKFGNESKIVSSINLDSPPEQTHEFSFSEFQQINSNPSIPDIETANCIVTKEQYMQILSQIELNEKLKSQYHQLFKENQEQLQIRKQFENKNADILDSNFQIKREIQEIKQKLFITQSAIKLRKDKQIIELKNQLKELQHKQSEKRDTLQSITFTENSTVESEKSNSQYCNTSRLVRVDQSSSHHQSIKHNQCRNNSLIKLFKN
ncbi:unnamed protein product (macronuclear) [Paramecium tetraurelia]|uniref:Uncharacterized protein n=1 Tax=Paramecium tetraurelia TaxID=5888 RepID=A0BRN6_PARTE|nr:uncharacterized protein GSPATT00031434001 [Paramecium tetraurelia]CAK61203.1 unnamed protein product [Paramecium tetraurelia]|eukprot:XP_001428601.1 hypothetical protein (macronuclear) [Paramecium tetraurelia strain d4-2]